MTQTIEPTEEITSLFGEVPKSSPPEATEEAEKLHEFLFCTKREAYPKNILPVRQAEIEAILAYTAEVRMRALEEAASAMRHQTAQMSIEGFYARCCQFLKAYGGKPPPRDTHRALNMLSDASLLFFRGEMEFKADPSPPASSRGEKA